MWLLGATIAPLIIYVSLNSSVVAFLTGSNTFTSEKPISVAELQAASIELKIRVLCLPSSPVLVFDIENVAPLSLCISSIQPAEFGAVATCALTSMPNECKRRSWSKVISYKVIKTAFIDNDDGDKNEICQLFPKILYYDSPKWV